MLNYLATHSRPDIGYAVSKLSQYQENFCQRHMKCIQHILRYLKGTVDVKLWLDGSNGLNVTVYTDASYAPTKEDRTSVTGYVVFLGNAVIEWASKKQRAAVSNTTEAELVAANKGHKHGRYFIKFLRELQIPGWIDHVPMIYCDNKAVIDMCTERNLSTEMRHVDIKYHELLAQVELGSVNIDFVRTSEQLADGLTKPVNHKLIKAMREGLHLSL